MNDPYLLKFESPLPLNLTFSGSAGNLEEQIEDIINHDCFMTKCISHMYL